MGANRSCHSESAAVHRKMSLSMGPLEVVRLACCVCLLLWACQASVIAQTEKPLATRYVECVRDHLGRDVASRTLRTPIFESRQGSKAYGVVTAEHTSNGCQNTATLYIADPGEEGFRAVLQQKPEALPDGTVYDGDGIEAIRWSPSGKRILLEVSQWIWGTDSGWNIKYFVLPSDGRSARELPIRDAVATYFSRSCVREIASKQWLDDTRFEIEVRPAKDLDEEGMAGPTPSCVQKPRRFHFDVLRGRLHSAGD